MAHGHRSCPDEALPAGPQHQTFDRAAGRIGTVQYPHRFVMRRGSFEDVTRSGDKRVDTTTQILEVDEEHVERVHHCVCGFAHVTIQTKDWNAVDRIGE